MSWQICAAKVEQGDPDRFAATMIAPVSVREKLFPLYAFNLELSEAAWASHEPLVCLIRLQFWQDALEAMRDGRLVPGHEVAQALAPLLAGADFAPLLTMIDARRREVGLEPFANDLELLDFLANLSGGLMVVAARILAPPSLIPADMTGTGSAMSDVALASALANWLVAVPKLKGRSMAPLPDESDDAIAALAGTGLACLNRADQSLIPSPARPALWPAFQARVLLTKAQKHPGLVLAGTLAPSPMIRSLSLISTRLTGRV